MKSLILGMLLMLACTSVSAQWSIASTPTTSIQGIACLGYIANPENLATTDPLDYVTFYTTLGAGCTYGMQVPLTSIVPIGQPAGFRLSSTTIASVLDRLRIKTFLGSTLQESKAGTSLLELLVGNTSQVFFYASKPFNSLVLELSSAATLLQEMRVYNIVPGNFLVLPVRFNSFKVSNETNSRRISWQQSWDEAVKEITLERSADGRHFFDLYRQPSPFSGAVSYSDPSGGRQVWYRLRGTTVSGKIYYSAVVSSEIAATPSIKIVTQAHSQLIIMAEGVPSLADIRIFTLQGQLLWQARRPIQGRTAFPFPSLPKGIYQVSIQAGDKLHDAMVIH